MNELREAVKVSLGPSTHGQSFIEARCYCGFEGHGRASEAWEEHWELKLPQVPDTRYHRSGNFPVSFHGRTWDDVKAEALAYLGKQ